MLGILIGLASENVGRILTAKAVSVLEVEKRNHTPGSCNGMKIKDVSFDISKPLKKRYWLSLSSGKRTWIQFT